MNSDHPFTNSFQILFYATFAIGLQRQLTYILRHLIMRCMRAYIIFCCFNSLLYVLRIEHSMQFSKKLGALHPLM